jgi:hypothetical protein
MIEHLYINGCSFAMDYGIRDQGIKQYADLLSSQNKWTLTNAAIPGSCNQRIIRSTVKDAVNFLPNTLAIISLSTLERTEIGLEEKQHQLGHHLWHHDYFVPIKHGWVGDDRVSSYAREFYRLFDWYSSFMNLSTGVFLLTQLFKQQNIQYLIFNYKEQLLSTQQSQVHHHPVLQKLEKDYRVLNLSSDHLTKQLGSGDWYYDGNPGHLNELGHARAAIIIQDLINQAGAQG